MTDEPQGATSRPYPPGPPPGPPPGGGGDGRRMARSRRYRVVGGVCGGLGRYFDLDPVIFRVALTVLSIVGGLGLIAYGVAWLVLPYDGEEENEARRMLSGRVEGAGLTALLFTVVGFGLLLASLGSRSQLFSVMLLGTLIGAAYWSQHRRRTQAAEAEGAPVDAATAEAVATAPPEAQPPPAQPGPSWWRGTSDRAGGYLWGPADADPAAYQPRPASGVRMDKGENPWAPPPGSWPAPAPGPARPRGFWLGGPVLLTAIAAAVVVTGLTWNTQPLGPALVFGLAAALAVFALGLVVGAFAGRLGGGTIAAVIVTSLALAAAAALPDNISTDWSDELWRPTTVAAVEERYEVGTGRGKLDLSGLELPADETVRTTVDMGAGQLRIIVPHDVTVRVTATIGVGGIAYSEDRYGEGHRPVDVAGGYNWEWSHTYTPVEGTEPGGTIEITAGVSIGQLSLERTTPPDVGGPPAQAPDGTPDSEADEAEDGAEDAGGSRPPGGTGQDGGTEQDGEEDR
ncbi:PspC domain-containing protein [Streptomyces sp. ACA25]|uniref:PspC domain-containing protein n=1 Tax=Streptomyces sp. ACA25 TaxID=3022596 RepID=UPI0023071988|nr:PspC domain-containing protein [Streptomyces sp. ACA25]MDB1087390.1 PspC domain-containing protein [Streptomyces sp. ACA25]